MELLQDYKNLGTLQTTFLIVPTEPTNGSELPFLQELSIVVEIPGHAWLIYLDLARIFLRLRFSLK